MEILAPAGDMEALKSAVASGADAVYLGLKDFNARSKAENFDDERLRLAVSYCHARNVRVYLTFNTLVKTNEMKGAMNAAEKAVEAGVDAFIVQDLGLLANLQKNFPDIPYHASTQAGVHNVYGALFAYRAGFDRVIFSREILPCDIAEIKEKTNLETEIFVHGAHCVSFSGNCYFSSAVSGYSGNRGKCMQLCRKKYTLSSSTGKKRAGYMLSAKDMCLIDKLPLLEKLGVDSLKIEGRLRSAEYTGTVTRAYKNALEGKPYDKRALETVFNRGNFSTAYLSENRPDIIYPVQQNNIGSYAGKIVKISNGNIMTDTRFTGKDGDGFKILRNGREAGGAACVGGVIKANCAAKVGDELRLTRSVKISDGIKAAIKSSENALVSSNYAKLLRKNRRIISDIVDVKYDLPEKCKVLCVDENCDLSLSRYSDIVIFAPLDYSLDVTERIKDIKRPILLDLPVEARGGDLSALTRLIEAHKFDGYVANNVYALELCREMPVLLGPQMNILNDTFDAPRISSFEAAVADYELIYAYGRQTLMNLTHCPAKQLEYGCHNCGKVGEMTLTDESGNVFGLRRRKLSFCYYELLNSRIIDLFPKLSENKHKRVLIDARNIDKKRVENVLKNTYTVAFDEKHETYGRWGKGVK